MEATKNFTDSESQKEILDCINEAKSELEHLYNLIGVNSKNRYIVKKLNTAILKHFVNQ